MSHDKELEIQLQFLDEAQEYLGSLETALLGLAHKGIDAAEVNSALRAAHSIKGGASLMGFHTLADLAHRMEDAFKVLKVQKNSLHTDAHLEALLLNGVDCLRQTILRSRALSPQGERIPVDPEWINSYALPLFNQIHDLLGDPEPEDAASILSPEEGQDIVPMLFQTEVEGCLERLESVLADDNPCLKEEVEILAQELGGLGEMLQLPPFSQLCQSIASHLEAFPHRYTEIAQLALQSWRRSQALVLTEQFDLLPTYITLPEDAPPSTPQIEPPLFTPESFSIDALSTDPFPFDTLSPETLPTETLPTETLPTQPDDLPLIETDIPHLEHVPTADWQPVSQWQPESSSPPPNHSLQPRTEPHDARITGFKLIEEDPDPTSLKDSAENSVRVPVKQLNQLNDLFGELTIGRNGLDLNLKRLRSLIRTLSYRVQFLEQSNAQLREAYDKISTPHTPHPDSTLSLTTDSSTLIPNGALPHSPLFDTLEMDRFGHLHSLSQEVMETIVQIQEVTSDVELGLDDTDQTAREIHKTAKQLQSKLTQVRMRPLSDILDRFPRALRELSLQYNKPVQLKIHGANTLVDRNILETLNDPLMHLLRNAFDHGIEPPEIRRAHSKPEQGTIEIHAFHRANRTFISLSDDGAGIPLDKIRQRAQQMGLDEVLLAAASDEELLSLIFEPGFSTADAVTSLSGRGVGMDVVRNNLKHVRGEIKVDTQAAIGTTFTISVPFTLSVARALLAESNGLPLAFPVDSIEEILQLDPNAIVSSTSSEAFQWNDRMVQLIRLSNWLHFNCPRHLDDLESLPPISVPTVLIVRQASLFVGIQIDRSWGEQEIAIRQLEGNLPLPNGFNNCSILGDGRVVPLVNLPELLHWIASSERSSPNLLPQPQTLHLPPAPLPPKPSILIIDDSINVRRLLALTLEKHGFLVAQAKDGQDALDKLSNGLSPHAIICDIEMPRLDGFGFLARIKASPLTSHIPVAMLTSRSGDKHKKLALSLGAFDYFSKPYNELNLIQALLNLPHLSHAS